ncbi:Protein-tyrosine sulfotransferase A [Schistosoma japonicum]|nr:Protein-tyrosine sulfotransferase A [Schistosoma japonicum]
MKMNFYQCQYNLSLWIIGYTVIILSGYCILNHLKSIEQQYWNFNETNEKETDANDDHNMPFIFIGGHKNSGTGLMGIILDAHSMIRCAHQPVVTMDLLRYRSNRENSMVRLLESGITVSVLNDATAAFIATVIKEMGPNAQRLCHKDPESFYYLEDLNNLFPKAKFIHMVRDGRVTVASKIANIVDTNNTLDNITEAILLWDEKTAQILEECEYIGNERCITIRYECLVLNPRKTIQKILHFLDLPWEERLLRYNETHKLIHNNSLDVWLKTTSDPLMEHILFMNQISEQLRKLNYYSEEIPPNYNIICND